MRSCCGSAAPRTPLGGGIRRNGHAGTIPPTGGPAHFQRTSTGRGTASNGRRRRPRPRSNPGARLSPTPTALNALRATQYPVALQTHRTGGFQQPQRSGVRCMTWATPFSGHVCGCLRQGRGAFRPMVIDQTQPMQAILAEPGGNAIHEFGWGFAARDGALKQVLHIPTDLGNRRQTVRRQRQRQDFSRQVRALQGQAADLEDGVGLGARLGETHRHGPRRPPAKDLKRQLRTLTLSCRTASQVSSATAKRRMGKSSSFLLETDSSKCSEVWKRSSGGCGGRGSATAPVNLPSSLTKPGPKRLPSSGQADEPRGRPR